MEVTNDLVFDLVNLKNVWINGNNMGFVLRDRNVLLYYKEGRNACDDDELDLPEKKIGDIQIKNNRFAQGSVIFAELDKDPSYSENFIKNNVKIEGNEISQRCDCDQNDLPNENDDEKVLNIFTDNSR